MGKYDLIIIAGQSNAAGCGFGPAPEDYETDERLLCICAEPQEYTDDAGKFAIRFLAGDTPTIRVADELRGGTVRFGDISLTFAREYIKAGLLAPDRKILIARCGVGGTGFVTHFWNPGESCREMMHKLIDIGLHSGDDVRPIALLWHQGENEAFEGNLPDTYYEQLTELIESVNAQCHTDALPFICGGFCKEWADKYRKQCDAILEVLRRVGEENGAYVETEDLLSNNQKNGNGDDIHFCRESLQILGKRYFEAYRRLAAKREIAGS